MKGIRGSVQLLIVTAMVVAVCSSGVAAAVDSIDVGGEAVAYDTSHVETSQSDGARRTTYYANDVLVAASWDSDVNGRDELWMRVDADWYVDRVAADRDADGIADTVVTINHSGAVTVAAAPDPTVESGNETTGGGPGVLFWAGIVLVVLAVALSIWFGRRRKGGATAALLVLVLIAAATPADAADPLWDEDCTINEERFDDEWEKYSDFDERVESPSPEVQQFTYAVEEAKALMLLAYEMEIDLEMEHGVIEVLREYRTALSRDQTRNLVRAFIRLTMLTGETINGARNLGSSIEKLGGTVLEQIGATLKLADHFQLKPDDQKKTVRSAVEGVSWSVFKEVLESMGDPKSVVTTLKTSAMEEANKLVDLPAWKISEAEFQVLRDQHLTSRALDTVMLEAERDQADRRALLESVEDELEAILAEADRARAAEKERVRALLVAQCETERDDAATTTSTAVPTTTVPTTTTTVPPTNVIEIAIADVGEPGVVQHDGRVLVNLDGTNVTEEASARGVVGNWTSTYRDASESVGGLITIDLTTGAVTGQVTEQWTCSDACLEIFDYADTAWTATLTGQLYADGAAWAVDGTVEISYSATKGKPEKASDCGGEPCYICADQYCTWGSAGTNTVPLEGSVDGTLLTLEFVDQLAEDITTMDFEPIRNTEFFMSRWLHQAEMPRAAPSP